MSGLDKICSHAVYLVTQKSYVAFSITVGTLGKGRVVRHSSNELNSYTPKKNIVSREQESDNNLVELWRGTKTTRRLHKREPHEKCQDIRLPHVKPHRAPYGESCVRLAVIKQLYGNQQSV